MMGYLVCEECGGFYKLQEGESPDDFERCRCGGRLDYEDSIWENVNHHPSQNELTTADDPNYELNFYQAIQQKEREDANNRYKRDKDKFFSSNFIINSGFIIFTFAIIPLCFGFMYSNWIFYLITGVSLFLSVTFLFLNSKDYESRNDTFQKLFIFGGFIFGLTTLNLLTLLGNPQFLKDLIPTYYSRGGFIYLYVASICFSAYFCYIFLKNSQMREKIDFLDIKDKGGLYFNYYYLIFVVFISMIGGMILISWFKLTN